jgi:hypothetical protein
MEAVEKSPKRESDDTSWNEQLGAGNVQTYVYSG